MKKCKIGLAIALLTALLMFTANASLIAQNNTTITGTVKSPLEIVDSKGVSYFLEFEVDSDDFDEKLIGKKIRVTGMLIEDNNEKTIYTKSYVVVK